MNEPYKASVRKCFLALTGSVTAKFTVNALKERRLLLLMLREQHEVIFSPNATDGLCRSCGLSEHQDQS